MTGVSEVVIDGFLRVWKPEGVHGALPAMLVPGPYP